MPVKEEEKKEEKKVEKKVVKKEEKKIKENFAAKSNLAALEQLGYKITPLNDNSGFSLKDEVTKRRMINGVKLGRLIYVTKEI